MTIDGYIRNGEQAMWQYTDSFAKVRAAQALGLTVVSAGEGAWKVWVPVADFGLSADWSR